MWKQHLTAKRISGPDGDIDGYHSLTKYDEKVIADIWGQSSLHRNLYRHHYPIFSMHHAGDRMYIGVYGLLHETLGEDHPYAFERGTKGRGVIFQHDYSAPKGQKIPDIAEFAAIQPRHLSELLTQANNAPYYDLIDPAPVSFSTPRSQGTQWDRVAREFETGRDNEGWTVFFTREGKILQGVKTAGENHSFYEADKFFRASPPAKAVTPAIKPLQHLHETAPHAAPAEEAGRFMANIEKIPGGKWAAGIAAAAVVAGTGWAVHVHNRKKDKAAAQEPGTTR